MENSIEPMTEGLLSQSNFTSDYADQIGDFRLAIQKAGLPPPAKIVSDGLFHRFPTNGRPKDDAGWYVLKNQPFLAGSFGCWRTGIKGSWSSIDSSKMTGTERRKFNEILEQIQITNDQKRHESQVEAALSARSIWNEAQDASSNHPYLKSKGIPAYGLREKDQKLIIPLYNVKGELMNLQWIFNDGRKRFLKNAQVKGLFFVIGNSNGVIYLGEGYATMASVHNATGSTCVAAFNANNLVHVGRELRKKYPEAEIILCADDDHTVQGNGIAPPP